MNALKARKRDHILKYSNETKYYVALNKCYNQLVAVCNRNVCLEVSSLLVTSYKRTPLQNF